MTRIYLIRHAQSEGNLYRRILGWYDGHVTSSGQAQIAALEHRFSDVPVDVVYSSDLSRAQETAQAVALPKKLEVRPEPAFRELHIGEYTNIPYGDLLYHHPDLYNALFSYSPLWAPKGGESVQQATDRIVPAFFRLARRHSGQSVAIFSHAMVIHCLQAALRGKEPGQFSLPLGDNTAVSCYELLEDRLEIRFENDVSHLPDSLTAAGLRRGRENAPTVWFRAMELEKEAEIRFYLSARQEAWEALHGSLQGFDGPGFLREAREQLQWDRHALQQVMLRGRAIGVLQLATLQAVQEGAGHISFLYLRPDYRGQGIAPQLLGQAVSVYRPMGRKCLRLLCAPGNQSAQRFYHRCGFVKKGEAPGALGQLDLLEMPL